MTNEEFAKFRRAVRSAMRSFVSGGGHIVSGEYGTWEHDGTAIRWWGSTPRSSCALGTLYVKAVPEWDPPPDGYFDTSKALAAYLCDHFGLNANDFEDFIEGFDDVVDALTDTSDDVSPVRVFGRECRVYADELQSEAVNG